MYVPTIFLGVLLDFVSSLLVQYEQLEIKFMDTKLYYKYSKDFYGKVLTMYFFLDFCKIKFGQTCKTN